MSSKVLFFGNERLGTGVSTSAPTLQALVHAGYEITGVVIAQNHASHSRKARDAEIIQVAKRYNIPVFALSNLNQEKVQLAKLSAEVAVLVAYGKIVPQNIIDIFPQGIINIHPSLLPKHRGPTPIESVILDGDTKTGASLMLLSAKMDSGAVYAQSEITLKGNETKQNLADQLLSLGGQMLLECLPDILSHTLHAKPQDDFLATYDSLIHKNVSRLDWNKPATQLEREIRAYAGWPRSKVSLGDKEIIVTKAHIETNGNVHRKVWAINNLAPDQKSPNGTGIIVESKPDTLGFTTSTEILMIDKLIPAGKNEMTASAFLAGFCSSQD